MQLTWQKKFNIAKWSLSELGGILRTVYMWAILVSLMRVWDTNYSYFDSYCIYTVLGSIPAKCCRSVHIII